MTVEQIHESLVNGQRRQMVRQIQEYGVYDFWPDYGRYLDEFYSVVEWEEAKKYFQDAVNSYFRITVDSQRPAPETFHLHDRFRG